MTVSFTKVYAEGWAGGNEKHQRIIIEKKRRKIMDDRIKDVEKGFVQGELVSLNESKSDVIGKLTGLLSLSRQLNINDLEKVTKEKLIELLNSIKVEDY